MKAQGYYNFVTSYYGAWRGADKDLVLRSTIDTKYGDYVIKPHYAVEPAFLMLAGLAASVIQQLIQHPINLIQGVHYQTLAVLDKQLQLDPSRTKVLGTYFGSYRQTYQRCLIYAERKGSWRNWLYRGFFRNTIKQAPSTSAGLIFSELVRRRYGNETEAVRIEKDGYDILLS